MRDKKIIDGGFNMKLSLKGLVSKFDTRSRIAPAIPATVHLDFEDNRDRFLSEVNQNGLALQSAQRYLKQIERLFWQRSSKMEML